MTPSSNIYQFSKETCEALEANLTIRFLVRVKQRFQSRHSKPVIAWAEAKAQAISYALLKKMGQEDTKFDVHINVIELLDDRTRTFFCFDLFLEGCEEETRNAVGRSTRQPIHYLFKKANLCFARRNERLDGVVAGEFENIRSADSGPTPYFVDLKNPPVYVDGVRVEQSEDENDGEHQTRSEQDDPKIAATETDTAKDARLEDERSEEEGEERSKDEDERSEEDGRSENEKGEDPNNITKKVDESKICH